MTNHFVSYPKSGRTWIRYVLHQLNVESKFVFHHDGFEFNDGNMPAHDFSLSKRLIQYDRPEVRITYLSRDPRDVMASLYHQITKRFKDFFHFEESISSFIRHPYFGADVLHDFRNMWKILANKLNILTITYEECHLNLNGVIQKILNHHQLGSLHTSDSVDKVCNISNFENMKKIEEKECFPYPWLRKRNFAPKVRKGQIGSYLNEFSVVDIDYLNKIFFGSSIPENSLD
jgi:hypothetical protein